MMFNTFVLDCQGNQISRSCHANSVTTSLTNSAELSNQINGKRHKKIKYFETSEICNQAELTVPLCSEVVSIQSWLV